MESIIDSTRSFQFTPPGSPLSSSEPSPLLRLPAELRNKIYSYVFLGTEHRVKGPRRGRGDRLTFTSTLPPPTNGFPLLFVCRQIHNEAALFPFHYSIFSFIYPDDFEKWANQNLLKSQRNAIEMFECPLSEAYFELGPQRNGKVIVSFEVFPSLKYIRLTADDLPPVTEMDRILKEFRAASGKNNLHVWFRSKNGSSD